MLKQLIKLRRNKMKFIYTTNTIKKTKVFKVFYNGELDHILDFGRNTNLQIKKRLTRLVKRYGYTVEPYFGSLTITYREK